MFVCTVVILLGGNWDEDDFISLHHQGTAAQENDNSEYEYFEYTSQPSVKGEVLTGVCRVSLPPFGGPFYVSYRRTFTCIAEKTLADVKPGEELKENDAVITRQNKPMSTSDIFQVSFQVFD